MRHLIVLTLLFAVSGCGVKGDPIPPKDPSFIGRGKPGFQRASEELDLSEDENQYKTKKKGTN